MDFDLGYTYKYTLKKGSKVVGYAEIEWYYLGVGYLKIYKKKTDAAPCAVCKMALGDIDLPLPGPLGLVFGSTVPVGIGFEAGGRIRTA